MHAAVVVRLASESHASQIAEMSCEYIEYGLGWRWTETRVGRAIDDQDTNAVVVLDGSDVRGFGIMSYSERHAHLLLLAVQPKHRRKGMASAILGWLESAARASGAERILVECRRANDPARCLCLDHGYHEKSIEEAMYRQQEDGIRLEKWLRVQPTKE